MVDGSRDCSRPVGGRLRLRTNHDGSWSLQVHPLNETFSLVLQGDAAASAHALLEEVVAFLHRVPR